MRKFATILLAGAMLAVPQVHIEGKEEVKVGSIKEDAIIVDVPAYRQLAYSFNPLFNEEMENENTFSNIVLKTAEVEKEKYSAFYVVTEPLNKRETPNLDFEPIGYLAKGEPVEGVDRLDNGWVELIDGSFVNGKYIIEQPGMTPEQFDDRVAIFKAEQEAARAERKRQQELAAQEEAKRREAIMAEQAKTQQVSSNKTTTSVGRNGISISSSDRELLARLVRAEAGGESYEGMVAVASVVFNRMSSGQFPSTVEGVVYAKNQFQPVSNGSINKPASDIHYQAVDDALTRDNTNGALFFYAPSLVKSPYMESLRTVAVIGVHHFKVN